MGSPGCLDGGRELVGSPVSAMSCPGVFPGKESLAVLGQRGAALGAPPLDLPGEAQSFLSCLTWYLSSPQHLQSLTRPLKQVTLFVSPSQQQIIAVL